jgi:precorrin-6B methylase 2
MTDPVYDTIGKDLNANRRNDPCLVAALSGQLRLPPGALLADIGAGTGNYANAMAAAGYQINAVEPSAAMRAQAPTQENVV